MTEGPDFAAAEMDEWLDSFKFFRWSLLAKDHFEKFYNNVGYPISVARGAYWLGRTYKYLGDKELSTKWFEDAAKYNYLLWKPAFMELDSKAEFELSKDFEVKKEYRDYFFKKEVVKIIYLLDELNEDKYTKFMLRHLANDNIDSGSEY